MLLGVVFFILFFPKVFQCRGYRPKNLRCQGSENKNAIIDGDPKLVRTVTNANLYKVGEDINNSSWLLLHLTGDNDYDMGVAYGEILKDEINDYVPFFVEFINSIIEYYIGFLPEELVEKLEKYGFEYTLDFIYEIIWEFTPDYFFDFLKGMAEGSGINYRDLRRLNMIPEIMKSHCTLVGGFGKSGNLLQFRGLDQSMKIIGKDTVMPMFKYPLITVHHYKDSNTVVNVGPVGVMGTLNGFSWTGDSFITLAVKWWDTKEKLIHQRAGFAYMANMFDVLRYSKDIYDGLEKYRHAKRTCSLYVGLGQSSNDEYFIVQYRPENVTVVTWANQTNYPQHPEIEGVTWLDKNQFPSDDYCLGDLLNQFYNEYSPEVFVRYVGAKAKTGDAAAIVWDFSDSSMYVSYGYDESKGYKKQYIRLMMKDLVEERRVGE